MNTLYDGIFDFRGLWDIPSKCGLKIFITDRATVVIVTELYKENPGSTITDVPYILAQQICSQYSIEFSRMTYIEHNPETKTKLSFYEEEYFMVIFNGDEGKMGTTEYKKITENELNEILR